MTLPILNLDQIVEQIEWAEVSERWSKDPNSVTAAEKQKYDGWGLWNQGVWAQKENSNICDTAYCQAGEAAVRAGYRIVWGNSIDNHSTTCRRGTNGLVRDIGQVATEFLGLADSEAELYFDGDNSIDDLKFYANAFAARRGLPQPYAEVLELRSAGAQELHTIVDVLAYLGDEAVRV